MKHTDIVVFNNKKIKLYLYYNVILEYFKLMKSNEFDNIDKLYLAVGLMTNFKIKVKRPDKLLELILTEHFPKDNKQKSNKKTLDLFYDFDFIRAGFQQAYNIDLDKERFKMSWKRFFYLFTSLPKDCKICQIMEIRARDIPAPTKYNRQEIEYLKKAKQMYALPLDSYEDNYKEQLNTLFNSLSSIAIKRGD